MKSKTEEELEQNQQEVSNLAKKLKHWDQITRYNEYPADPDDFRVATPASARKKGKNRAKLSNRDILSIGWAGLVRYENMADIAKEFRTSVARVSQIIKKVRQNKEIFAEMQHQQEE